VSVKGDIELNQNSIHIKVVKMAHLDQLRNG